MPRPATTGASAAWADAISTPLLWLDASGHRVQWCNAAARAWLGAPKDRVGGLVAPDLRETLPPHEWAGWAEALAVAVAQAQAQAPGAATGIAPDATPGLMPDAQWHRLTAGVPCVWSIRATPWEGGWLVQAWPLPAAASGPRQEAQRRDLLVREVHHRLKNNLQGVAALIGRLGVQHPELAEPVRHAVSQIHSVAEVYGVQVHGGGAPRVDALLSAVATAAQRIFGVSVGVETATPLAEAPRAVDERSPRDAGTDLRGMLWAHLETAAHTAAAAPQWCLNEDDATSVALALHELLTNAIKHGPPQGAVECVCRSHSGGVMVEIVNTGALPPGFDLAAVGSGVSGLGLVRALLPRRGSHLELLPEGPKVCARLHIAPPCVRPCSETAPQSLS